MKAKVIITDNKKENIFKISFNGHSSNSALCAWLSCISELLAISFTITKENITKDLFNVRELTITNFSSTTSDKIYHLRTILELLRELSFQFKNYLEISYFDI